MKNLLMEADSNALVAREKPLLAHKDNRIAISRNLTGTEKKCVLAEELGHYYTRTGDILDQSSVSNRKQEFHGRIHAYDRLIGLMGIVDAHKHHCHSLSDAVEYLDVTEEFSSDALIYYKAKYGRVSA